ncbi:MAG: ABC transporter ATP-binding protein/permease [Gemmatimonadota bacterium]|nr:ABC transporter ATP-binding protein/permease [Gemmatimonadota bacterium]
MTDEMTTSPKLSVGRKIWAVLLPVERRRAVILLGLMLVGMVLEMLSVGLIVPALALLTQPDFTARYPAAQAFFGIGGNPSLQSIVTYGLLAVVGMYFVKAVFLAFLSWRQARFVFGLRARLSQQLFAVYLSQPYTFHLQRNSAKLISHAVNEVIQFTHNGLIPGMLLLTELLVMFGLCSLLVAVEPIGAAIVMGVLGTASWGFYRLTQSRIARWGKARQYHDGLSMQHLQQGLGGVKEAKLLGREGEFLAQYRIHNAESVRISGTMYALQQLPRLWLEVLAVSGLAILVMSMLWQHHALEAVLPTLGLFAASAFRLMPSVNRALSAVQSLRYGLPAIDVLHKELGLGILPAVDAQGSAVAFHGVLEIHRVTYAYPGSEEPALKDISLAIHRGESVGFVGASGAGKSTLVDMLLGLLTPSAGDIRVDGKDIHGNLRSWQDQIGYVPQSIFLTDDTLRRNVAFGLPNDQIDDAAVQRAVRAAQLEELVCGLPNGLETIVGERGVRLSGGQRQRIGIARALYHDPSVLVLDEATSALDTVTEEGVMQAVRALQGTKTVVIVAHRLSTVAHCDRLYRLQGGKLAEEGTVNSMLLQQQELEVGPAQAGTQGQEN